MKYLITGFSGFVSYFFIDYLNNQGSQNIEILGMDICEPGFDTSLFKNIKISFSKINLIDFKAVETIIVSFRPDRILHLASYSSVAKSWIAPVDCFTNNTNIFLNILEVIRLNKLECRILSIGSSEEYGSVSEKDLPLVETRQVKPLNPYAVARVSQEFLSKVWVDSYQLDIVLTRSFNHIGSRQRDIFVIPSFVKQICKAKLDGSSSVVLHTGDVDIVRDFLDVRDVVRAYFLLFEHGHKGSLYNVCSGVGHSLRNMISILGKLADMDIRIIVDPEKVRINDNQFIVGSNEKICIDTKWVPSIKLEDSLSEIIKFWIEELSVHNGASK